MKSKYKVKYNNSDELVELIGYSVQQHIVALYYQEAKEKNDGFILYNPDGTVLKDCSEYKYRYDVLEDNPNAVYYTDLNDLVQTEKWGYTDNNETIDEEPLSNEELTECVSDLLYEVSLIRLGMEE